MKVAHVFATNLASTFKRRRHIRGVRHRLREGQRDGGRGGVWVLSTVVRSPGRSPTGSRDHAM